MLDQKFLTTEQVANILQVHPFTILKFIKQGKLQGLKLGRMYRIQESEVERFIEERMTTGKVEEKKVNKPIKEKIIEKRAEVEIVTEKTDQADPYKLKTEREGGQYYII